MKTTKEIAKHILIALLYVVILSSCNHRSESVSGGFASARQHYGILLETAKAWKDDAYLSWYSFDSLEWGGRINAHFQSLSDDYHILSVTFDPKTDVMQQKIIKRDTPIKYHLPISETDWEIDSVEAAEILLAFDDVRDAWGRVPAHGQSLKLRHFYVEKQWVLAWILTLSDDAPLSSHHFYVDSLSGERIELKY
jgi:hypothetical protein